MLILLVNKSPVSTRTLAYLSFPVQPPPTDEEVNSQVKIAEKECLEARATYSLKQSVVEDVLIVDPVLKAVHSGLKATPTERYAISPEVSMTRHPSLLPLELYVL